MKSPSRLIDSIAKRNATKNRAARSRTTSVAGAAATPSNGRGCAWATLGNTRDLRIVDEVGGARAIEQLLGDRRLHPTVAAERRHLVEDVARMARAHRAAGRAVVPPLQVRHHHRVERQ